MGYDPFSPVSAATVNVLCVPASQITASKFNEILRALQAFSIVSLKGTGGGGAASPSVSSFSAYNDGSVLLSFSKDIYLDTLATSDKTDSNVRPQVILGLVDGDTFSAVPGSDHQQSLEHASTTFRQSLSAYDQYVTASFVVLGGKQLPTLDDSYFVDLDGEGPSLLDVVSQIVTKFQTTLQVTVQNIQANISSPSEQTGQVQSSSGSIAGRTSETGRMQMKVADTSMNESGQSLANGNLNDPQSVTALVVKGQLSLQAGQWPHALRYFSEGASDARVQGNDLSQAKALEGLLVCMLLLAWAHLDFNIPQICYPATDRRSLVYNATSTGALVTSNRAAADFLTTGRSVSSAHTLAQLIPHLVNTIVSLYERAASFTDDVVLFQLVCQARIRCANLLLIMKSHGSVLQDSTLRSIVEGYDDEPASKVQDTSASALSLHTKTLTNLLIESALEAQMKLTVQQAARIQIAVTVSLSRLRVERKQAFHLREFLRKLGPALVEARRIGAAEVGIHPAASVPLLDTAGGAPKRHGQNSIRSLLDSITEIYGLSKMEYHNTLTSSHPEERLRDALYAWSFSHQNGNIKMKAEILGLCIEVCDAVPDIHGSLNFISQFLQLSITKVTIDAYNPDYVSVVPASDQSHLLLNIKRLVAVAERYGIPDARTVYWDKCLIRAIEVAEDASASRLMPHTARDLTLASDTKNEAKKDPFIFNPFAKAKAGAGKSVIVVGEQANFAVVLQNPLQVDVEIEDISLWTEGSDFLPDHHSIVLGPLCTQTFVLSGKAQKEGGLTVLGCKATIQGCHPEEFVIVQTDWKATSTSKQMAVGQKSESRGDIVLPQIQKLLLQVIGPLPNLTVASSSLAQHTLMLLEGQSIDIKLSLQNNSYYDIDFLLFTFEDSVTRRLEEALGNKDLMPADLYEIQNQIATRPIVRLKHDAQTSSVTSIKAGAVADFVVETFGRPGLTEIAVLVDYAFLGKPKEEINDPFYTRQLRYILTTTINGSVDIPRCSILPLESDFGWASKNASSQLEDVQRLFSGIGSRSDQQNQCMLLLDVRNIWPQPLEVEFEAMQTSEESDGDHATETNTYKTSEILQPGQLTRVLLLVPRILLADPYTPIPSLDTKRQFVVSASKMTIEAEAASRESFWYRERLLSCLQASWKEPGSGRVGKLDMRKGIRLSSRMIDALRIELVAISFSLEPLGPTTDGVQTESQSVLQTGISQFRLVRNSFARLVVKVHNQSKEELKLLLRLQPSIRNQPHNVALDLSKRLAWSGVLQQALHPALKVGDVRRVELGIVALAEGEYEVNGTIEEIQSRTAKASPAISELGGGVERRIWHSERPCLIDAVDEIVS